MQYLNFGSALEEQKQSSPTVSRSANGSHPHSHSATGARQEEPQRAALRGTLPSVGPAPPNLEGDDSRRGHLWPGSLLSRSVFGGLGRWGEQADTKFLPLDLPHSSTLTRSTVPEGSPFSSFFETCNSGSCLVCLRSTLPFIVAAIGNSD